MYFTGFYLELSLFKFIGGLRQNEWVSIPNTVKYIINLKGVLWVILKKP